MVRRAFASSGDLAEKEQTLEVMADGVYALTAQGDPNVAAVEGEDFLVCFEAMATPVAARAWLERLRHLTDKPVRYLVHSHYHAVRVLGASAFDAQAVVAHDNTRALIAERGQEDWDSEFARLPRLAAGAESVPGLTWPTLTFSERLLDELIKAEPPIETRWGREVVAPGILIPDAPVHTAESGPTRLRTLARAGLLLLTARGVHAAPVREAAGAAVAAPIRLLPLYEIDPSGALADDLGARPGEIWVVRPDAYVAAVVSTPEAAAHAVRRMLGASESAEPMAIPRQTRNQEAGDGVLPAGR